MDAEQAQMVATIRPPRLARSTATTTEVGFDRTGVANLNAASIARYLDNLPGEFVAQNSGIGVSRMPASKRMQVAAADSNLANADQRLSERRGGTRCLFFDKLARRFKQDLAHTLFRRRRTVLVQPLCTPLAIIRIASPLVNRLSNIG